MATLAAFSNFQKKKLMFQAWRNYLDTLHKEAFRGELETYRNDPRYTSIGNNVGKMKKEELVVLAEKECDLTQTAANEYSVLALRALIRMKRKGDKLAMDPMMVKPKGLGAMKKDPLIAEAQKRSLTVDMINPSKKEWKNLTRDELILGITDHVRHLNNSETAILNRRTSTNASASTRESSSDSTEFMDVRAEEPKCILSYPNRRKRESEHRR